MYDWESFYGVVLFLKGSIKSNRLPVNLLSDRPGILKTLWRYSLITWVDRV